MNVSPFSLRVYFLVAVGVQFITSSALADEIEAVSGRTSADYRRAKQPDGSFPLETYAFGKGGFSSGPMRDKTIDESKFMDIASVMAEPLKAQNYLPTKDAKTTKLLIMVYWGTTDPPPSFRDVKEIDAALASGPLHRKINADNARILGYDSWWSTTASLEGKPGDFRRQDMIDELEDGRYFVVLMAYDFQLMWRQKKSKLLWETRFSIRARGNAFDQQLPAMALYASKYFGQDSRGLVHRDLPEGKVELGELKSLGTESAK